MARSPYAMFKTDKNLEENGIWLDYGDFRILVARAGGNNQKYKIRLAAKMKPYIRAIHNGTMSEEKAENILREVYTETVILAWETKNIHGDFVSGILDEENNIIPDTKENILKTLEDLDELY